MIAAIGIAVLDNILIMDGFKEGEGSFHCDELLVTGGGMAATAMCAASKLGSETRLFTRIGDDVHGRYIIDELGRFGVDTSGVITVSGKNTTNAIVLVDSGTGKKQFYSERGKPVFSEQIPLDLSLLNGTEALLVDGHWIEGTAAGVKRAKSKGIPVVADFKGKFQGIDDIFPFIDYLIIPSFFAGELTGKSAPEDMLKALNNMHSGIPVVTCGERGGSYIFDGEIHRYRPFPVKCVDSTGAGDAFHGAFCHFLERTPDIHRCIELASAVGALNCRALGGRASLPSREELIHFLGEHGVSTEID